MFLVLLSASGLGTGEFGALLRWLGLRKLRLNMERFVEGEHSFEMLMVGGGEISDTLDTRDLRRAKPKGGETDGREKSLFDPAAEERPEWFNCCPDCLLFIEMIGNLLDKIFPVEPFEEGIELWAAIPPLEPDSLALLLELPLPVHGSGEEIRLTGVELRHRLRIGVDGALI